MEKHLDFVSINTELIKASKEEKEVLIAAQDSTFVSKSGKKTPGLDYFWNGCAGKPEKGLEVDVIAAVRVKDRREAFTISAKQSPSNPMPKSERKKGKDSGVSKIDFCLGHLRDVLSQLIDLGIKRVATDAFFTKIKYVDGVVSMGLHVIGKLRRDARLRRLYTGEQKARGRKKKFDVGKVTANDFAQSPITTIGSENIELQSCIAHGVSLNRVIKIVLVRKRINDTKYGEALLFSTDLTLTELQIFEFYVSRFQIEFIFRDAKGFTGFADCQSRNPQRMNYHFNASLTALNVARVQDAESQKIRGTNHAFSMNNWFRQYHVEIVVNRIIAMFGLDPTFIKYHPDYENLLSFGNIMH
jgi:hypothetical protein